MAWAVAVAGGVVLPIGSGCRHGPHRARHTFDGLPRTALMVAMYVVVPFVAAVAYLVTRRRVVFTVLAVVCVALAAVGIFFWLMAEVRLAVVWGRTGLARLADVGWTQIAGLAGARSARRYRLAVAAFRFVSRRAGRESSIARGRNWRRARFRSVCS